MKLVFAALANAKCAFHHFTDKSLGDILAGHDRRAVLGVLDKTQLPAAGFYSSQTAFFAGLSPTA
jgi:hypothetical protein